MQKDDSVDSTSPAAGNLFPCSPSHLISALPLRICVEHEGEKLLHILGTDCFFVKSMRYFETEACLLETPFPFPFQTTFTFFPTFIILTQVNLILTIKPILLYLLSWLLFSKLFPSQTQFTILQQLWSFHPQHWNRVVKYPFCKAATWVQYWEKQVYLTFSYSPPSPKISDTGG